MVEKIRMNVNDTLELDYLVEKVSRNAIDVANEPNNVSTSIDYISTETGIFDPPDTGTYQLNINGQTIEIEVNDITDSAVLNTTADDYDGAKWVDTIGSNNVPDVSGDPSVVNDQINGYPAVYYDGSDISQTTSSVASTDPIAVIFTARLRSNGPDNQIIDSATGNGFALRDIGSNHRLYRGSSGNAQGAALDTSWHVWTLEGFNGTDIRLRIDGGAFSSDSLSSQALDGLTIAARANDLEKNPQMDMAEFTVLENHPSSDRDSEEQRQADKYGITA